MTRHYFENPLANLHYYRFGNGEKIMLCFHGFGMHGKQFKALEPDLGSTYTFFGFDLFFHKETQLKDQSLEFIKKGLSKKDLAGFITDFCNHEGIGRFSVIGYSMGTHYATTIVEEMGDRVNDYIVAAPSSIDPGRIIRFFSKNITGNKLLEKLVLSEKALINMLNLFKSFRLVDNSGYEILLKEINTAQLRFNLYACFTYLRFLETDENRLIKMVQYYQIKSIFIFGKHDKMYGPGIGKAFFKKLKHTEVVVLNEDHEMINQNFVSALSGLLL
jgi:pimeloyl-ACP methyl ester carboxylesterase